MHTTRADVERFLGKAVGSSLDKTTFASYFYEYRKGGDIYKVEFAWDKSFYEHKKQNRDIVVSIEIVQVHSYLTPEAALQSVGLSMGKKRPAVRSKEEVTWKGLLFPSGIRQIKLSTDDDGKWSGIEISDKQDPS